MNKNKKTKIVATLGPSCDSKKVLHDMIKEGVNVFRINFSHADHKLVKEKIKIIRDLNNEFGYTTAILADLQGPKLRVGKMKEDTIVSKGDHVIFDTKEDVPGTNKKVFLNYKNFAKDVNPGEKIVLDDGKLIFKVLETNKRDTVKTEVIQGGALKSKKGVNLPNTDISLPALTEKDKKDAKFAIENQVDWIALSFVRTPRDITQLQDLIAKKVDHKIPIIAKIEKPEAVENIDGIVAFCDGLMVARGDLGVEIPPENVPLIQKQLIQRAKKARIPVIVATQMMESMITHLTPTRAEVNDVANSVMDGADAVMLSGETSVGAYPVQVIQTMSKVIRNVEDSSIIKVPHQPPTIKTRRYITKTICQHAALVADTISAKVITTLTNSGYTAFQISAWRPKSHIIVFSSNRRIINQLSLVWGVNAFYYDKFVSTDDTIEHINIKCKEEKYVTSGDMVVNLAAMPIVDKGMVNTLRISEIN